MTHDPTMAMLHERQAYLMKCLSEQFPQAEPLLSDLADVHAAMRVFNARTGTDGIRQVTGEYAYIKNAAHAAQSLLRKAGDPLERHRIIHDLIAGGWGASRKDPAKAISQSLKMHTEGHQHKHSFHHMFAVFEDGKIGLVEWKAKPASGLSVLR